MLLLVSAVLLSASVMNVPPVNPNASQEARELLNFLYLVNGRYTLSGQHNQMYHMSEPSDRVEKISGRKPLVWGGEWGFSDERHDIDNIKYRPRLLDEIRKQHQAGRIICLTWHQASPTIGEPCDFAGGVQVKLTDAEWDAVLSPGTKLHQVWLAMVDELGVNLAKLRDEHIPIIFRPYHEMNGGWFWWGGKPERFIPLWNAIYDRLVNHHKLNNLLWAWNPDKPYAGVEKFFPGHATVDLLGTDIYPAKDRKETYPQEWYDRMKAMAGDKPLALSEISELPTDAVLAQQPFSYFMSWDDLVFKANTDSRIREGYSSVRVMSERPKRHL